MFKKKAGSLLCQEPAMAKMLMVLPTRVVDFYHGILPDTTAAVA